MASFIPSYIETFEKGLFKEKIEEAYRLLKSCVLCPRKCGVDRLSDETGICNTGKSAWVSSANAHFGEEDPLVGRHGSGTIFFTHCNLMCLFCQNFDISHQGCGNVISDSDLARIMLALQKQGCHNINFVTPSHVVPQILSALEIAIADGLSVPLVFNTGGYDRISTLKLLEGVFDIYMPDFKFWDADVAEKSCQAADYPEVARKAVKEMHRQVGDLQLDEQGIAYRGLLIRHLVLPGELAGTQSVMRYIAQQVSPNTYVNIMSQYRPCGRAAEVEGLGRNLKSDEYHWAVQAAKDEGITRFDRRQRVFLFR